MALKLLKATYCIELSLADTISVEDDSCWLEACWLVELYKKFFHHWGKLLDDLLSVLLYPNCGRVSTRVSIHTAHNLHKALLIISYLSIWENCKLFFTNITYLLSWIMKLFQNEVNS